MATVTVTMRKLDPAVLVDPIRQVSDRVVGEAHKRVPRRTGRLSRALRYGIRYEASSAAIVSGTVPTGQIIADTPYAIYVHEGTGRYGPRGRDIVAKPGRVFVFTGSDGRTVFTHRIRGQRPQPFLRDALRAVTGQG